MAAIATHDIASFLGKIRFFSELSDESLREIGKRSSQHTFQPREKIFEKGDPGDALYAIYSGKVSVHDEAYEYGLLGHGDCFGEYSLIDREARSASVTAREKTIVFRIGNDVFAELMSNEAGFVRGILKVLIDRHRELDIAQEELASSKRALEAANERMKGLIEGAMDIIVLFDYKFRILLSNQAASDTLENDDVLQRNILYFLPDSDAELLKSLTESLTKSKTRRLFIPSRIRVIGSNGGETLNEGTLSCFGDPDQPFFILILRNIEERLAAEDQIDMLATKADYLQDELDQATEQHGLIARDESMINVLNLIRQVAQTDSTVLIQGETGTGKELVAKAIHEASNRNDMPFIRINCGAIPSNLIESELFGHEKGAFTGATSTRKGRFLLADQGTLFLDEIGELPMELQPKLLRVIQEGEFDPVGSNNTLKVNVRILAATHRDLKELSDRGKFREDLYYRLNVFPIYVPPLRARGADVCLIADKMIDRYAAKFRKPSVNLSKTDRELFMTYQWPGNVRELQNLIERAMIISNKDGVDWSAILPAGGQLNEKTKKRNTGILTDAELNELEKENVLRALRQTKWKISGKNGAAELLGIPPTTLASKIKTFGLKRPV